MGAVPRMPTKLWDVLVRSAEEGKPSLATSVLTGGRGTPGFVFDYRFDPPWQENYILDERKSKIVIGGYGSGKTLATVMGMLWFAFLLNDFRGAFAAPRNKQTMAALEMISGRANGTAMEPYVTILKSPTPRVDVKFLRPDGVYHSSSIVFLNNSDGFRGGLSMEFDWAHAEECFTLSPDVLEATVRNLGSRARGTAVDGRKRLGWFTMSSNPEPNPYGWYLFDVAAEHPDDWFVYISPSFANLNVPDEHLLNQMKRMTDEGKVMSYLLGKRPADEGAFFPPRLVAATRSAELRDRIVSTRKKGKFTIEFMAEPLPNAVYVLGIDLGSGVAPFRNAPVIVVYEIEGTRVRIPYLWWGDGRVAAAVIRNIIRSIRLYSPIRVFIDATGSQRGFFGIITQRVAEEGFTTPIVGNTVDKQKKSHMVYAISALLMGEHLEIPAIHGEGIIGQLISYPGPDNDKKSDQDIVMAMSMAAPYVWQIVSTNKKRETGESDALDEIAGALGGGERVGDSEPLDIFERFV